MEDTHYLPDNGGQLKQWVESVIVEEGFELGNLNYIFTSDAYLLKLNQKHLNHDTLTDILTFDLSSNPHSISGDIFISVERVKANAEQYHQLFETELRRVMIHGVLHLIGYDDRTPEEKSVMRKKEEAYLSL